MRGTSKVFERIPPESCHFYPRSPCGERRGLSSYQLRFKAFLSTFPLRGTSSCLLLRPPSQQFLSTFLLRGTSEFMKKLTLDTSISIHVPLAGNVNARPGRFVSEQLFLSTFPLRGTSFKLFAIAPDSYKFLSTFPLRGTSSAGARAAQGRTHFYPRSPCGERLRTAMADLTPV